MTRASELVKVPAKVAAKAAGKRKAVVEATAAGNPSDAPQSKLFKPTEADDATHHADRNAAGDYNDVIKSEGDAEEAEVEAAPTTAGGVGGGGVAGPSSDALALAAIGAPVASPSSDAAAAAAAAASDAPSSGAMVAVPKKGKEAKGGSAYKGVYLDKTVVNKWKSSIRLNQREVHLGYYASETEAARAYDKACICVKGEPKNLPRDSYTEEEITGLVALDGDVETLRKQMGVGVMVGQPFSRRNITTHHYFFYHVF